MCSHRLGARIDVIDCHGFATLPGYDLFCDKQSLVDGSGKFTIAESHLSQVPGVLFTVSASALDHLDSFEGPGYQRIHVTIDSASQGMVDAVTYVALSEARNPDLRPYEWYLAFAAAGATEHQLPRPHIHRLQDWPCWSDPDAERDEENREILNTGL